MSMPDPSPESEVLPRVPAAPTAPLPDSEIEMALVKCSQAADRARLLEREARLAKADWEQAWNEYQRLRDLP